MTKASAARPSTPRLSECARHFKHPDGIVATGRPWLERRLRQMGANFDPWQWGIAELATGMRADGIYAATVGGVTLSIPRQVGKTYLVGLFIIAMCLEFPGTKVVWTAHHLRTSTQTFRTLQGMVKRPKVSPHMREDRSGGVRTTNGEQELAFRNGSIIMFGARSMGFGRGFSEVDVEVFDEAQILPAKALEDMIAATNQARHPHGALLFFMGTPPRQDDESEAFTSKHLKALDGKLTDGVYVEFSADPDGDYSDPEQWAIANPSYPKHTPHEAMLRLRENLPNEEAWRREAMGVWDPLDSSTFDLARWAELGSRAVTAPTRVALVLDVAPDRSYSTIGVAGAFGDHAMVMERTEPGTAWVVPAVARYFTRGGVAEVALWPSGQAGALVPELTEAGIPFEKLTAQQLGAAWSAFQEHVKRGTVTHPDQPDLNAAVGNARTRFMGEAQVPDRRNAGVNISPVVACSAALYRWGLLQKRKGKPRLIFATPEGGG